MSGETSTVLQVRDVSKSFGPTKALKAVSLTLRKGEIHALLGGNGSGKSTVIKALAGVQPADEGTLNAAGREIPASAMTPALAREVGLRFVHQNHSTFADLTVSENLQIVDNFGASPLGRIGWKRLDRLTRQVLDEFHINAAPRSRLGDLGPATQAMVTIARALMGQNTSSGHVLVLDEPTASLPAGEVSQLLESLTRLADSGHTILYVTHRLNEVLDIGHAATIFRDGRVAAELSRVEMTHQRLVEEIMGRKVESILDHRRSHVQSSVVLNVEGLAGGPIVDATFQVHEGEIVGVAGVLGSGRSSLLRMIFGDSAPHAGSVLLNGSAITPERPKDGMRAGVALVPEDRAAEASFSDMSVVDNLGMCVTDRYFRFGVYHHAEENREAADLVESFSIKTPSVGAPLSALSGGNQQKVILARWMRRNPKLLLLDEPTQGVDVASRAEIWTLVREATAQGTAVLVVSSDFEELPRVCDRVLVLRGGRIVDEVSGADLDESSITHLAMIDEVRL